MHFEAVQSPLSLLALEYLLYAISTPQNSHIDKKKHTFNAGRTTFENVVCSAPETLFLFTGVEEVEVETAAFVGCFGNFSSEGILLFAALILSKSQSASFALFLSTLSRHFYIRFLFLLWIFFCINSHF